MKWTEEHVLHMPARRFFAMSREVKKIQNRERFSLLAELCDVAAIPAGKYEFYKRTRESFIRSAYPNQRRNGSRTLDAKDPLAAQIIISMIKAKKKSR